MPESAPTDPQPETPVETSVEIAAPTPPITTRFSPYRLKRPDVIEKRFTGETGGEPPFQAKGDDGSPLILSIILRASGGTAFESRIMERAMEWEETYLTGDRDAKPPMPPEPLVDPFGVPIPVSRTLLYQIARLVEMQVPFEGVDPALAVPYSLEEWLTIADRQPSLFQQVSRAAVALSSEAQGERKNAPGAATAAGSKPA